MFKNLNNAFSDMEDQLLIQQVLVIMSAIQKNIKIDEDVGLDSDQKSKTSLDEESSKPFRKILKQRVEERISIRKNVERIVRFMKKRKWMSGCLLC